MRKNLVALSAGVAMLIAVTACSSESSSGSGGGEGDVKLGLMTSVTGSLASSFGQATIDGAQARISLANDTGELAGTKVSLVVGDERSDPNQGLATVQQLVDKEKVFAVLASGAYFFNGYRYTVQKNVPAIGMGFDGPQWSDKNNSNLFAAWGSGDPAQPDFSGLGDYFKSRGGSSVCSLALAGIPQTAGTVRSMQGSAQLAGLQTPYLNTEVPPGSTDFTAVSLAIKSSGCDILAASMTTGSYIALLAATKNAGVTFKTSYLTSAYDQAILDDPAALAVSDGIGFGAPWQPASLKSAGTTQLMDALAKYAGWQKPNPTPGQMFGWFTADLAIKGLKVTGENPTQEKFIESLRKVTDYDANGLICPVDMSKWEGYIPGFPGNCTWVAQVENGEFTSVTGQGPVKLAIEPGTSNK
ncbi:ABC transporter substrate-binding protein [Rhodococcus globerulus]|uniref:ABC transporter substrate-binding protein n=1 Tax=Rhodococcus globerulus TaxID=33008 RepID=A0ABU4C350_RHOGO|nr:ABC transporter substrate-binding protein [Rhodococcus globerulus]MDV6270844.1 ABC transporter substrate-binding protein [Rhodococcus globerulus]